MLRTGPSDFSREPTVPDWYWPVEHATKRNVAMLPCSKKPHSTRWSAECALRAIQRQNRARDRTAPTGTYWCRNCKAWHVTSKSASRPPPWERGRGS
jgi:hypothetical protein